MVNKRGMVMQLFLSGCLLPWVAHATSNPLKTYLLTSRLEMVAALKERKITEPNVLKAMTAVPREVFVPKRIAGHALVSHAYDDDSIAIEYNRIIPQPYLVARIAQSLAGEENDNSKDKVLEIGTSSGYQTAVLAKIFTDVYSMEIVKPLADQAERVFKKLNLKNVHLKNGDGYHGWKENAPYDAIVVNAALDQPSSALLSQLKPGGILVIPIGVSEQMLTQIKKTNKGDVRKKLMPVRFSPMTRSTPELPPPPPPEVN